MNPLHYEVFEASDVAVLPEGELKDYISQDTIDVRTLSLLMLKHFSQGTVAPSPPVGSGLPNGGDTGEILVKQSPNDGDALWEELVFSAGGA